MKNTLIISVILLISCSLKEKEKTLNTSFEDKNFVSDENGNVYVIENSFHDISKYNKNNQKLWSSNILEKCGKPFVGKPEIRVLEIKNNKIFITYGKHNFAEADINTGKINCLGAD